jgi:hypothetical protein
MESIAERQRIKFKKNIPLIAFEPIRAMSAASKESEKLEESNGSALSWHEYIELLARYPEGQADKQVVTKGEGCR